MLRSALRLISSLTNSLFPVWQTAIRAVSFNCVIEQKVKHILGRFSTQSRTALYYAAHTPYTGRNHLNQQASDRYVQKTQQTQYVTNKYDIEIQNTHKDTTTPYTIFCTVSFVSQLIYMSGIYMSESVSSNRIVSVDSSLTNPWELISAPLSSRNLTVSVC